MLERHFYISSDSSVCPTMMSNLVVRRKPKKLAIFNWLLLSLRTNHGLKRASRHDWLGIYIMKLIPQEWDKSSRIICWLHYRASHVSFNFSFLSFVNNRKKKKNSSVFHLQISLPVSIIINRTGLGSMCWASLTPLDSVGSLAIGRWPTDCHETLTIIKRTWDREWDHGLIYGSNFLE